MVDMTFPFTQNKAEELRSQYGEVHFLLFCICFKDLNIPDVTNYARFKQMSFWMSDANVSSMQRFLVGSVIAINKHEAESHNFEKKGIDLLIYVFELNSIFQSLDEKHFKTVLATEILR